MKRAQSELTRSVIDLRGVTGTAIGEKAGSPCLKVYVEKKDRELLRAIPDSVRGFPVVVEQTGTIRPR